MMAFDDLSTPGVFRNGEYTVAGLRAPVNKPFVRIAVIQNVPWSGLVSANVTDNYWGELATPAAWTQGTHTVGSNTLDTTTFDSEASPPFPSDEIDHNDVPPDIA